MKLEYVATSLSISGGALLALADPSLVPHSLLLQIAGGTLWSIYSIRTHQIPLLIVNLCFILIEMIGVYRWYTI